MKQHGEMAITTSKLVKKFGNFMAVDNLNLQVKKGEIYGLLGPNGAGKTTLIKMLCSVLNPTSGEARVLGEEIPDGKVVSRIGYMPQETGLYLGLTVDQNMKFYGRIFNLKREEIEKREDELLKFVDLSDWKHEMVENLSGGMKHRVSLACTLIHQPELLFLDEPTVGVDPELRVSFWNYFNRLRERGVTILITTHYMDEARHCDRIGFMQRGRIIAEDAPSNLLEKSGKDSLEDAFLVFSGRDKSIKGVKS
ncbi:ABC transporter ATP-binding protein [Methanobacterium formicicum]|uniref:Sulfate-transporting ATPase n=1 Tax=Methanobacterium formicicum (strain DSM 3637 / PP1) TaxID=1204725 RepID=K2RTX7_METFP|nr:ABC transporter ATP-binding protein [Methanobacterium formicicum]EKF86240.1 sulfate-transporting ATPase [Methanobacterium formicicum DSM 3637]